jgi:hypothetical protein
LGYNKIKKLDGFNINNKEGSERLLDWRGFSGKVPLIIF